MLISTTRSTSRSTTSSMIPLLSGSAATAQQCNAATGRLTSRQGALALSQRAWGKVSRTGGEAVREDLSRRVDQRREVERQRRDGEEHRKDDDKIGNGV